ncbi:peptide/nickel transport system permease protein [Devosia lucknowensis]|uniref:Peptide/nickel transport system permease protein n=1 Tax=Devosia lucknowensis TaxID=1096929 RepID=A0A1Y6G6F0_9HYPH|nr:peptide/nickel transport system permease protein [Devosia lucknowensis]
MSLQPAALPAREPFLTREARSTREAMLQRLGIGTLTFLGNRLAVIGVAIILLLVVLAVFAPWIATHDPNLQNLRAAALPPSGANFFGTDEYGRDIYSRIVYGSRITLYIVGLVTITVGPIGLIIGAISGYFGGFVDTVVMRITDLFLAFPSLILTLAFVAVLGPGLEQAVLAIALTGWPAMARLARAETLTIRSSDYIAAAKLQGASSWQIIIGSVIPMCMPSVIVRLTLNMASVILTAAGLGFLGLGAQPPTPEWGAMTSTGRAYMLDSWWMVTFPGLAIMAVSLAFNLFGDGLRDVLDPKSN